MKNNKKLKKHGKKLLFITFIYVFVFVSILAPFITIEGANRTLGYILLGVLSFIYLLILVVCLWDWLKED